MIITFRDPDGVADRVEWLEPAARSWLARTPKAGPVDIILAAHDRAGSLATDLAGHPTFWVGVRSTRPGPATRWARFGPIDGQAEADPAGVLAGILDRLLSELHHRG